MGGKHFRSVCIVAAVGAKCLTYKKKIHAVFVQLNYVIVVKDRKCCNSTCSGDLVCRNSYMVDSRCLLYQLIVALMCPVGVMRCHLSKVSIAWKHTNKTKTLNRLMRNVGLPATGTD